EFTTAADESRRPNSQADDAEGVDDEKCEVQTHLNRDGTVPRSRADGSPPDDVACVAARTIASDNASAASAPIVSTSACPCHFPVASAKTVSPSAGVCAGLIARARPSSAINAMRLA